MNTTSTRPSMEVSMTLNGEPITLAVHPGETLLEALRQRGFWSVKHGCESGDCGACTVLVDGVPRVGCLTLAAQVDGHAVTTLEGLGGPEHLHPLQESFVDRGAVQCGYCTPGMLLSALALLERCPEPTVEDVKDALSGNLCRCTGYHKPVEAVMAAARAVRAGQGR